MSGAWRKQTIFKTLLLFLLCSATLLLSGCTESDIVLPYTNSQFISQSTDLNYSDFVSGVYDGNFLMFDGNKLSVGVIDINSSSIDWNNLINFPSGCAEGQAVKIVGSSLVCVDLTTDTNFETAGYDFDDYAKLDGSNMPFTGNVTIDNGGLTNNTLNINGATHTSLVSTATDEFQINHDGSQFKIDSTGRFVFDGGNVGINTSNPSYALEITKDSGENRIRLNSTSTAGIDWKINGSIKGGFLGNNIITEFYGPAGLNGVLSLQSTDDILFRKGSNGTNLLLYDESENNWDFKNNSDVRLINDNQKFIQGAGDDFSQYFDGTYEQFELSDGLFYFSTTPTSSYKFASIIDNKANLLGQGGLLIKTDGEPTDIPFDIRTTTSGTSGISDNVADMTDSVFSVTGTGTVKANRLNILTELYSDNGAIYISDPVGIGTTAPGGQLTSYVESNGPAFIMQRGGTNDGDYTGVAFIASTGDGTVRQKGALFFERMTDAGRGKLVFALNAGNDTSNVTNADSVMEIDYLKNVNIFGDLNISEDLNVNQNLFVDGNLHYENFYAEGYYGGGGASYIIELDDTNVPVDLINWVPGVSNGFVFDGNGVIVPQDGVYQLNGTATFVGGNGSDYGFNLAVDGVPKMNCSNGSTAQTNIKDEVVVNCLLDLNAGNYLEVWVRDRENPAQDIEIYKQNFNIHRISD